jgi:hypothetical protein
MTHPKRRYMDSQLHGLPARFKRSLSLSLPASPPPRPRWRARWFPRGAASPDPGAAETRRGADPGRSCRRATASHSRCPTPPAACGWTSTGRRISGDMGPTPQSMLGCSGQDNPVKPGLRRRESRYRCPAFLECPLLPTLRPRAGGGLPGSGQGLTIPRRMA